MPEQQVASQSPNLLNLSPSRVNELAEKHHLALSAIAKIAIILTQAVFVGLLGWNSKAVTEVAKLENQVRVLETQIESKRAVIEEIEKVILKTNRFKALETQRAAISTRVQNAIAYIPPKVTLTNATIKPDKMVLVVQTDSPIDAAVLINNYFTKELASQITLNSANLSTTTGKFITNMEVLFK